MCFVLLCYSRELNDSGAFLQEEPSRAKVTAAIQLMCQQMRCGGSLRHGIERDPEAECSLLGGILSMPAFTGGDGGGV